MPVTSLGALLGQVIVEQRRAIGLSQEALAHRSGLHRTYVSEIERGLKVPTVGRLFALAGPLQLPPSELLRRIEGRLSEREERPDRPPARLVAERRGGYGVER